MAGSASASLINASFEDPPLALGTFSSSGIIGWGGGTGVWHIPSTSFFETTAPDGLQIGYSNTTNLAQQSTNVVSLGANTVTVQAGRRHDGFAGSFDMKVWAGGSQTNGVVTGGTLLTTVHFDHTSIPPDSFVLVSATYTADVNDPNLGQFITVQFVKTSGSQINIDDVKIFSADSETVPPSNLSLSFGKISTGSVASLETADNTPLVVCKFIVPNQTSPFVQFAVTGNTTLTSQKALRFRIKSAMATNGSFTQTLRLFNFVTNAYEESRTDTINTGYQYTDLVATGDVSRYVGTAGALQSQVQIRQVGPSASTKPCVNFDYAAWDVTQ